MPGMNMMNNPNPDDKEAAMARADLYKLANYSFKLFKMIRDGDQLEGWVQAKVTKAADYIASVYHYMEYEMKFSEYGNKLENSDMYTEEVRQQYLRKLNEARNKLEKLKSVHEQSVAVPQNPDGATAPPKKDPKTGRYPKVTSGPNKGKEWSEKTPGPTNPAMKEATKGDGNLANNAKPYDKVTRGDVIAGRLGKDEKGGKTKKTNEVAALGAAAVVAKDVKRALDKPLPPSMQPGQARGPLAKKSTNVEKEKNDIEESEDLKKVGDTKKTRTGELTKTKTGVVHKRTDYSDDERGEAPSTVKQKSAAEKKADKSKDIKLPKHKGNTWGMKGGEKFGKKMETAVAGAPQKSGIPATAKTTVPGMRATQQDLKKAGSSAALGEGKCNHTPAGKKCPVHGLKECGGMYEAKAKNLKQQAAIAIAKKKAK
jgi:hypothetical protein